MLWPRLSPERSCVCCRSRRRLGRLRARPASHCNLDRVVFRYQNERRSRRLGGLFLLRNVHRPVRNPASPIFSPALGPIRTARIGLSAVGRDGLGRTSRLPRRTLRVRFRFQSRRPRPWSARSGIRRLWPSAVRKYRSLNEGARNGSNRPEAALRHRSAKGSLDHLVGAQRPR